MNGPTTFCVRCNKATPLLGRWVKDVWGDYGEVCPKCECKADELARGWREIV